VGCFFSLVTISFAMQKLFSFIYSYLSVLSLNCWAIGVLFRNLLPVPICSSIFPILSYSSFTFQILHYDLWFILDWYYHRVKDRDLISVFYMQISSFPSTTCWRCCLFSIMCFDFLWQKSGGYSYVGLILGLSFCSIGICVCFCASTMSKAHNWEVLVLRR
jgi:hypothetical protein